MQITRILTFHHRFLVLRVCPRTLRTTAVCRHTIFNYCKCTGNFYNLRTVKEFIYLFYPRNYLCTDVDNERVDKNSTTPVPKVMDINFESIMNCAESLPMYSEEQILKVLGALYHAHQKSPETFEKSLHYKTLLAKVNSECISRSKQWDPVSFVNFLKRHHEIGFIKGSKFLMYALNNRYNSIVNGSFGSLREYLRIMNETDYWRKGKFRAYELEYAMEKHFQYLTCNEIELFLKPLSISQRSIISDPLKKALCEKVIKDIDTVSDSFIKHFFALFCGQAISPHNPMFLTPCLVRILKGVEKRIESMDFQCVSFIALFCSRMLVYDKEVLDKIAVKLLSSLGNEELRDIERTISSLIFFNHGFPPNLYDTLVDNMRENMKPRFKDDPECLVHLLCHLSMINVYPYDLIEFCFRKSILFKAYPKLKEYNVKPELRLLLGGLHCESKVSETNRVKFDFRLQYCQKYSKCFPNILRSSDSLFDKYDFDKSCLGAPRNLTTYNRVLYCTRGLIDEIFGGTRYTNICYIFSHFSRANILFCLDDRGHPIRLPGNLRELLFVDYLPYKDKYKYHVVVFKSKNVHMDYEPMFLGEEIAKVRRLTNFGCKVIGVPQQGWLKTLLCEKRKILNELIFGNISN